MISNFLSQLILIRPRKALIQYLPKPIEKKNPLMRSDFKNRRVLRNNLNTKKKTNVSRIKLR